MNFLGDKITTATTIVETMSELTSTELLEVQALEGKQKLIRNYTDIWVSKSNIVRKVNDFQEIQNGKTQVLILPKSHNTKICNRFQKRKIKIIDSLQKLFFKKKRFIFQILKQFFLFPNDSQSSISPLSTYDPLIFKDQIIHSLVKKIETKIIENKIWGFLNLTMRPYLKAVVKIERASNKIYEKVAKIQKKESLVQIKKFSDNLISYISRVSQCFEINSNSFLENEGMKRFFDERKKMKGQLNSGIIQEKVSSVMNKSKSKIELQSTTRIYTREEYERKYGKSLDNNDFGVSRYNPSEENRRDAQHVLSSQVQQVQKSQRSPYLSPVANKHTETSEYQNKEHSLNKKGLNKCNIIYYHEGPRQVSKAVNRFQPIRLNAHCCCFSCCAHYCSYCEYGDSCCCNFRTAKNEVVSCCYSNTHHVSAFKDKSGNFNETAFTQKHKGANFISQAYSSKKISANNELSQLKQRIQYLHFLRKAVKQQQVQEATK